MYKRDTTKLLKHLFYIVIVASSFLRILTPADSKMNTNNNEVIKEFNSNWL